MKTFILLSAALLMGFLLTDCTQKENAATAPAASAEKKMSPEEQVERGAYLVGIMGCNDCHTPKMMTPQGPAPDPKLLLSGHPASEQLPPIADKSVLKSYALFNMNQTAAIGPWGTSFAGNLTPDGTGLGNWTLEQFGKAMKQGKAKGLDNGRMLLPPMPWLNYASLSSDDLSAIFAYLKSLPPVKNIVPAPMPPGG
ncbi:MAG: diheme cytochrome c-553 [Bacteroidetes bacterium]|nr:diheme cytochrome c-553 [Bacteroidota bacterium]